MLKTICCCFCIRRKSKVTVAPNSAGVCGEAKSGRFLVQTAPGRLISVILMTTSNIENSNPRKQSSRLGRQRNGRISILESIDRKDNSIDSKALDKEDSKTVHDLEDSDQEKGKTVVVIVDIERPKTGDTIASKVSLPPLRSGSPVTTGRKIKKIKWNLRRRTATPAEIAKIEDGKVVKSISTNSITASLVGMDIEVKGEQKQTESAGNPSRDDWRDEIVTLPGTTADFAQESNSDMLEDRHEIEHYDPNSTSNVVLFFIHGVGGNNSIWANQMKFFHELGKISSEVVHYYSALI